MSIFVIDAGNAQIKVGKFENHKLIEKKTFQLMEAFYLYYRNQEIDKSILSSVRYLNWNPEVSPKPIVIGQTTDLPFNNCYATRETLGNDRKALVAGAVKQFPNRNCLIIDAGTCITYDFVDKRANYYGGSISPGFSMRYRALNQFTAKLPLVELVNEKISLIGDSTENSIKSGVYHGIKAEIEGFISRYAKEYSDLAVLITGGDAKYFEKHLKAPIFALPNLQMEGLYHILQQND